MWHIMKCAENLTDVQCEQLFDLLTWLTKPCGVSALATLNSTFQHSFILIFVVSSLSSAKNWVLNSGVADIWKKTPTTNTGILRRSPAEQFDFLVWSSLDFFLPHWSQQITDWWSKVCPLHEKWVSCANLLRNLGAFYIIAQLYLSYKIEM